MTGLQFIYDILGGLINLFFTNLLVPNTNNVYIGWVFVAVIVMGITITSLLNIVKGAQAPKRKD